MSTQLAKITPQTRALQLDTYDVIEATPVTVGIRGFVLAGLFVLASFVGGAVYWAASSNLDGAVVAQASLVVDGNRKTVEHLDGGIVRSILVQDGDIVEAGDVLIELDGTDLTVDLDVISAEMLELIVRRARLLAQLDQAGQFTADAVGAALPTSLQDRVWADVYRTQRLLFEAELRTRLAEEDLLNQRIANLRAEMAGLQDQLASNGRLTTIAEGDLANFITLRERGVVAEAQVNTRRIELERLTGEEAALRTQLTQAENEILELQLTGIGAQTQRDQDASSELAQVEALIAGLEPQFDGATERLARTTITAPEAGQVTGLSVFTVGGIVRPGEPLLDIVPLDEPLVVEAQVDTDDIDRLFLGQTSRIRLSAFTQSEVPEATGQISEISADRFEDERTGRPYYLVRVDFDAVQPEQVAALNLLPGMPADLFVTTGERSVLSYLTQPIQERLVRTFTE